MMTMGIGHFVVVFVTVLTLSLMSGRAYADCLTPPGVAGEVVYNSSSHVAQYCNDNGWVSMGPVPGAGGAGCSNPDGVEGEMVYNTMGSVVQYCDGAAWQGVGK